MLNADDSSAAPQPADSRVLYRFLRTGVSALVIVVVALHYWKMRSMAASGTLPPLLYLPSAASIVAIAIGLIRLRPRVPRRRLGETLEQYWTSQDVAASANMFWFVMEAGAVLGAVGYLVAGDTAAAAIMLIGVAIFWLSGPNIFGNV